MALTVGELVGFLRMDARGVDDGVTQARRAMNAAGGQLAGDADRAGGQAGQALGDGITRGADGRLRNARGRFVAAGRRAGDAVGDGLADGAADGADDAVQEAGSRLDRLKLLAAGAGVAAGGALMMGLTEALDQSRITGRLGAQLGATPAVAQKYGKIAGSLYASAVTEDFQGAADAISATMRSGLLPPGATNSQIESISTKVSDLAGTFELDLGQAANAAGQMLKTGLARNGTEALDVLTRGLQVMGPRADDIADTFNEYSTIFRQMGISATDATGLMSQGLKAGARDTDVVADSLKEFVLITQGGGDEVDAAFKKIGLSGTAMQTAFSKGGPAAKKALDQVFDRLRTIKDPADRSALALTLFGTKAEDTQKALFSLDPSKAAAALGKVGGAADKMGDTLRDNAGTKVEQFKRGLTQGFVNVLGGQVIPKLQQFAGWVQRNQGPLTVIGSIILGVVVPALILMGVNATVAGARVVGAWVVSGAAALRGAATQALAAGRVVGAWALMAARSLVSAARMAASWLIALGPVGLIIAAVVGLVALIVANWDTVKRWTAAAWGWVWGKIKAVAIGIKAAVVALAVAVVNGWIRLNARVRAAVASAWNWVRNKISSVMTGARNAVTGSISRIGNAFVSIHVRARNALAGAGRWLLGAGRSVVTGLWNGIKSMGGWIAGKVKSWARTVIPGPIASALGIASPSRVTTAQGRWIARGLVQGLTGSGKQVRGAATKLADIVRDSLAPSRRRSRALSRIGHDSAALLTLAGREEKLAARMKSASKRIADQLKAREKLTADVKRGVLDSANITQGADAGPVTADTILAQLTEKMGQARAFAAQLATLRKKGVRSDLITQIAQAGVEQGSGAATALAMASKGQLAQINRTQGALVSAAGQAGAVAGTAMYGAGIRAAQGLVKGLRSQQSAIERQMLVIARGMSGAIRRALGIRSPSRVMADQVGRWIPAGIAEGIASGQGAVNRTMAGLVPPLAPFTTGAAAADQGAAGGPGRGAPYGTVRVQIDLTGADEDLKKRIRKIVKVDGRGNVQVAFGRK